MLAKFYLALVLRYLAPMFGNDRNELRRLFFNTWHKAQQREPLEPLEGLIAEIIKLHPEYHALLADEQANLDKDYTPEMGQTNPFLHMAMHISLQEQLQTDRPAGVRALYQQLMLKQADPHEVRSEEHTSELQSH